MINMVQPKVASAKAQPSPKYRSGKCRPSTSGDSQIPPQSQTVTGTEFVKMEPQQRRTTRAVLQAAPMSPADLEYGRFRRTRSFGVDSDFPLELPAKKTRKRSPKAARVPMEPIAPKDENVSGPNEKPTEEKTQGQEEKHTGPDEKPTEEKPREPYENPRDPDEEKPGSGKTNTGVDEETLAPPTTEYVTSKNTIDMTSDRGTCGSPIATTSVSSETIYMGSSSEVEQPVAEPSPALDSHTFQVSVQVVASCEALNDKQNNLSIFSEEDGKVLPRYAKQLKTVDRPVTEDNTPTVPSILYSDIIEEAALEYGTFRRTRSFGVDSDFPLELPAKKSRKRSPKAILVPMEPVASRNENAPSSNKKPREEKTKGPDGNTTGQEEKTPEPDENYRGPDEEIPGSKEKNTDVEEEILAPTTSTTDDVTSENTSGMTSDRDTCRYSIQATSVFSETISVVSSSEVEQPVSVSAAAVDSHVIRVVGSCEALNDEQKVLTKSSGEDVKALPQDTKQLKTADSPITEQNRPTVPSISYSDMSEDAVLEYGTFRRTRSFVVDNDFPLELPTKKTRKRSPKSTRVPMDKNPPDRNEKPAGGKTPNIEEKSKDLEEITTGLEEITTSPESKTTGPEEKITGQEKMIDLDAKTLAPTKPTIEVEISKNTSDMTSVRDTSGAPMATNLVSTESSSEVEKPMAEPLPIVDSHVIQVVPGCEALIDEQTVLSKSSEEDRKALPQDAKQLKISDRPITEENTPTFLPISYSDIENAGKEYGTFRRTRSFGVDNEFPLQLPAKKTRKRSPRATCAPVELVACKDENAPCPVEKLTEKKPPEPDVKPPGPEEKTPGQEKNTTGSEVKTTGREKKPLDPTTPPTDSVTSKNSSVITSDRDTCRAPIASNSVSYESASEVEQPVAEPLPVVEAHVIQVVPVCEALNDEQNVLSKPSEEDRKALPQDAKPLKIADIPITEANTLTCVMIEDAALEYGTFRRTRSFGVDSDFPLELPAKKTRKRSPRVTRAPVKLAPADKNAAGPKKKPTEKIPVPEEKPPGPTEKTPGPEEKPRGPEEKTLDPITTTTDCVTSKNRSVMTFDRDTRGAPLATTSVSSETIPSVSSSEVEQPVGKSSPDINSQAIRVVGSCEALNDEQNVVMKYSEDDGKSRPRDANLLKTADRPPPISPSDSSDVVEYVRKVCKSSEIYENPMEQQTQEHNMLLGPYKESLTEMIETNALTKTKSTKNSIFHEGDIDIEPNAFSEARTDNSQTEITLELFDTATRTNSEKDDSVKLCFDFRDAMETELVLKNKHLSVQDNACKSSSDSNQTELYTETELSERLLEVEDSNEDVEKTSRAELAISTDEVRDSGQVTDGGDSCIDGRETVSKSDTVTELKHQDIMFGLLMIKGDKREFFCNFCLSKSNDETAFMDHVSTHLFVCGVCKYQAFTRISVVRHILRAHPKYKNELAKLHTMHLDNKPLKPIQLNLSLKKRGGKRRSWSNVLAGTVVSCTKLLETVRVPTQYEEHEGPANDKPNEVCSRTDNSLRDSVEMDKMEHAAQNDTPNEICSKKNNSLNDSVGMDKAENTVLNELRTSESNMVTDSDAVACTSSSDGKSFQVSNGAESSKLGINVLHETDEPAEGPFVVAIDRTNESVPSAKLFQCRKCSFREYDIKVIELHQKAHSFNKLTVILSAYGVICPYCQIVYRTLHHMFEHLQSMHMDLVPSFFLVMRCMGANDMYYFCPCCNAVNSDHMKHIILNHVLTNHNSLRLYTLLRAQLNTNILAERYYVDLWVNGFRLNKIDNLTVVIPDPTPQVMVAPTPIELLPRRKVIKLIDWDSLSNGDAGDLSESESSSSSNVENLGQAPFLPQLEGSTSMASYRPPPPPVTDLSGCSLEVPPFIHGCDSTIFNTSDICQAFPGLHWLAEQYPKRIVRMKTIKTYGRMLVLYAEDVPKGCVLLDFKQYFFRRQDNIPECRLCAKTFVSVQTSRQRPLQHVEEHVFCHFDVKIWMCPYCRSTYKKRCGVIFHIKALHLLLPLIVMRNLPYLPKKALQSAKMPNQSDPISSSPVAAANELKAANPKFVYVCFFCPRQTNGRGAMLRHVRYVHPTKPFSQCMFQKYLQFRPDLQIERSRIEHGLLKASVCVVKVEDMDEFEGLQLLRSNKVPPEDEQDEDGSSNACPPSQMISSGSYECLYCPFSSDKLESNKSHILLAHANFSPVVRYKSTATSPGPRTKKKKEGRLLFLCPVCSFFSDRRSAITEHARRYPVHFTFLNGQDFVTDKAYPPEQDVFPSQSPVTVRERLQSNIKERLTLKKRSLGEKSGSDQENTSEPPEKRPLLSAAGIKLEPMEDASQMQRWKCCLCDHKDWSCATMKLHYHSAHPKCAVIIVDMFESRKIFMCPEKYCGSYFVAPGLVIDHLIHDHHGDPSQLRFAYTEEQIAFQQYTAITYQREQEQARSSVASYDTPDLSKVDEEKLSASSPAFSHVMAVSEPPGSTLGRPVNALGGIAKIDVPAIMGIPLSSSGGHDDHSSISSSSRLSSLISMASTSNEYITPAPSGTVVDIQSEEPEQEHSLPQIISVTGSATEFSSGGIGPSGMATGTEGAAQFSAEDVVPNSVLNISPVDDVPHPMDPSTQPPPLQERNSGIYIDYEG